MIGGRDGVKVRGMVAGRLRKAVSRKLPSWERAFSEPRAEPGRPLIFDLLFWAFFAVTYASYLRDTAPRFGVVPVSLAMGALAAVWAVLPWSPRVPRRRMLAAPAFLVVTFAVGCLTGLSWSNAFYSISVANGVFLFGFARGLVYAAALLPVIFSNYLLARPAWGFEQAALITAWEIPTFAFVTGICAPILRATERQKQTQALLAELESAHAELKRYAARARELAISEERARMAREMHDTVGHYLTVVNVQLEAAGKLMDRDPSRAKAEVDKAKTLASEALSEVRRSVRALKPLAVEERTGAGALRALIRGFEGTGPAVSFDVVGEERELAPEAELVLYRALQEGLTNALRHSNARHVRATLAFENGGARLTVSDDGEGVPEGTPPGFGLSGLRERAAALGGGMRTGNAPEGGFALEVRLPVGEAAR